MRRPRRAPWSAAALPRRSIRLRATGAACAAAAAGVLLFVLVPGRIEPRSPPSRTPPAIAYLLAPAAIAAREPPPPPVAVPHPAARAAGPAWPARTPPQTRAGAAVAPAREIRTEVQPDPGAAPGEPAVAWHPPAPAASQPLQLDPQTLGRARSQATGAIRQMAAAAGQELGSPRLSPPQRLAAAIGNAGVPGCLGPDALRHDPPHLGPVGLGGALSLPFLAHAALTGRCR